MSKTIVVGDFPYHVKCNGQPRHLHTYVEAEAKEFRRSKKAAKRMQSDFDYLSDAEAMEELRFFEYRGSWYDLHDGFVVTSKDIKALGFDAAQGESYFSAVAVRYFDADGHLIDGGDSIVVGNIHW